MSRLAALAATLVVVTTGCTGEDEPTGVARTDTTSETPTGTSEEPGPTPSEAPEPVVFYSGSGVTANAPCGKPAARYVTLLEEFDVNLEVRFGEVTTAGAGRLVGQVFVAPTSSRGPNEGTVVFGEKPGFGRVDDGPEWRDRVPLQGRLVQPGSYLVYAQVRLSPGTRMQGLDFSYFDSSSTGSARLDVSARVTRKCGR